MWRYKSICIFPSLVCLNIHSCSKGWKEIHCNANRVSSLKSKSTNAFSSPLYFSVSQFFPRTLLLHDGKKTMFYISKFMPQCQCNWKRIPLNLWWLQSGTTHSLWDRAQITHREEPCSLPCPRLGRRAPLASFSHGPGSLLFPYGFHLHLLFT